MQLGKSVSELFDSMGIYEYELWSTYYSECPFGYRREDLREALSCKILLAPYTKSDLPLDGFLLDRRDTKKEEPPVVDLVAKTKAMFRGMSHGRK